MHCQRTDTIGRQSATLGKLPVFDGGDSKRSPIMFGIGKQLPAASKSKDARSHLAEGHQAGGGQSSGRRHHHCYGATDNLPQPEGRPDLLSCEPRDHKHIHRVFQVNRVTHKICEHLPVCHGIVKERKRKFLPKVIANFRSI